MNKIVAFIQDETGASAAEYALILAIIGTAIATAMVLLGNNISAAITAAATKISTTKN